ncbi:MAG: hypothetical protein ACFFEW_16160 [Candidatus Thorarchaeota archaeon]
MQSPFLVHVEMEQKSAAHPEPMMANLLACPSTSYLPEQLTSPKRI